MDAKNMDFTLEELKILAENGQKDLEYAVGYYYENGIHTLTDFGQAAQWLSLIHILNLICCCWMNRFPLWIIRHASP